MDFILNLIVETGGQVWTAFLHNWPFLALSVVLAALLRLYLDSRRVAAFLLRHQRAGVVGATAVAVTTPLCSCGTTAIILGMMANYLPWAPIVAFMVSSPLTSPQELVYSAGLFGWPFALAFFAASIFLGMAGGVLAGVLDRRGWLADQVRQPLAAEERTRRNSQPVRQAGPAPAGRLLSFANSSLLALEPAACACSTGENAQLLAVGAPGCACDATPAIPPAPPSEAACGCTTVAPAQPAAPACGCQEQEAEKPEAITLRTVAKEIFDTGKRLLLMFLVFAFVGYFLNGLIPPAWVSGIFGSRNAYSVPLAAILGLPLYVNSEASLPLVRAMLDAGMSAGAALAFLITGAGTSFGAVAGMLTIARWRVVGLVVGTLWVGAVLFGVAYNLIF